MKDSPRYRTLKEAEACDRILSIEEARSMSKSERTSKMTILTFGLQQFMGKTDPVFMSLSYGYQVALERLLEAQNEERENERRAVPKREEVKTQVRDKNDCGIYEPGPSEAVSKAFVLSAAIIFTALACLIVWLQFS